MSTAAHKMHSVAAYSRTAGGSSRTSKDRSTSERPSQLCATGPFARLRGHAADSGHVQRGWTTANIRGDSGASHGFSRRQEKSSGSADVASGLVNDRHRSIVPGDARRIKQVSTALRSDARIVQQIVDATSLSQLTTDNLKECLMIAFQMFEEVQAHVIGHLNSEDRHSALVIWQINTSWMLWQNPHSGCVGTG